MITVAVNGDKELITKLDKVPAELNKSLTKAITILTLELKNYIIRNKLSGQVLNHRTGNLWRSIQAAPVINTGDFIEGKVFSSGDVKYAAIHEYGGTIKHPGGTPYYLDKKNGGKAVFVSKIDNPNLPVTKAHDINMPQRSFMRSSLRDFQGKIRVSLDRAVKEIT